MCQVAAQAKSKKYKRGDEVVIRTGASRRVRGTIEAVTPAGLIIKGVAFRTHFVKPNPEKGIEGGLVRKEAPIDPSNVAIWNPKTGKGDKVGFRYLADAAGQSKKVRVFKSTGEVIDL